MIVAYQSTAARPNSRALCRAAGRARAAFYRGRALVLAPPAPGEVLSSLCK